MQLTKTQIATLITAATIAINLVGLLTGVNSGITCRLAELASPAVAALTNPTP